MVSFALLGLGLGLSITAEPSEVDRLVVRAARPEEAAYRPSSISVIDDDITGFLSPRAPAELLNRAPGVFVQAGSGREHLTAIRSPVLTGGAGAGSFLFLQDGVPLRASGFANVNGLFHAAFPFAETVAIRRGPGDVGYGANALHGAIDVRTPDPGEGSTSATFGAGAFGRWRGIGQWDSEDLALGLSVFQDGGYREASGATEIKGRAAMRLGGGTLRFSVHDLDQETAGFVLGQDAYRDDALRRSNPDPEAFRNVRHALLSYDRSFTTGAWQGEITPYARWTDMAFRLHFLPGDALEENEHASIGFLSLAERNLAADVRLALGFDLDLTRGSLREFQEAPRIFSFTQGLHYDYSVSAAEAAPFAKLTWDATPRLTWEAGLRASVIHYDYETEAPVGEQGRYLVLPDRSDTYAPLTGRIGGRYAIDPDRSVHVALARGARAPQTTELYRLQPGQEIEGIEPEVLDSAEFGFQQSVGAVRFAVTAFAMRKDNVFFRDADGLNVTDGRTTHVGIEGEGEWALTPRLSLAASGTYAKHRYAFDRR
ncbi:MAG: TonB-dependent receptor, partial [Parvularcula sp.]|nr:TonB-dependent receptor [Parvularcula sp.]